MSWEFPGGPMVGLQAFTVEGMGLIPDWGTEILHVAALPKKKKENSD